MIFKKKPLDFKPKFEVVSCFVQHAGKILLLKRQNHKTEGGKWGVPAGKVDEGEALQRAILREIEEETGIEISETNITYFNKIYVRYEEFDFIYHIFHTKLKRKKEIKINKEEHEAFIWVSPLEALNTDLVQDQDTCTKLFFNL